MSEPKRYRLKKLQLHEISVVDRGADPNAVIQVFKRYQEDHPMPTDLAALTAQMETAAERLAKLQKDFDTEAAARKAAEAKLETAQAELAVAKAAAKPATDDPDELLKGADPAIAAVVKTLREENAKAAKQLDAIAEERAIQAFAAVAKADYTNLAIKADDFAPILKRASGALPEDDFKELTRVLKAASAAVAGIMTAAGVPAYLAVKAGSAEAELNELAKARAASDKVTIEKAYSLVAHERPDLYRRYLTEQGQAQ